MKVSFPSLPTRTVTLTRDGADGQPIALSFTLVPWPIGYADYVARVYPPPAVYVDLRPVEKPEARKEYDGDVSLLLLARSMGDQLDARAPGEGAGREAWAAHVAAIRAELAAANMVEGDILKLITEAGRVNRGAGKLGKGD